MKRWWKLCAVLVGLLGAGCGAQTVHGTVLDRETNSPLPGATVQVGDDAAVTDAEGDFLLEVDALDEGDVIVIEAPGYESVFLPVEGDEGGRQDARLRKLEAVDGAGAEPAEAVDGAGAEPAEGEAPR